MTSNFRRILLASLLCAGLPVAGHADHGTAPQLRLVDAKAAMAAAIEHARSRNAPGGAIAIVDAGGHLVLLERLDGTFAAAPEISQGKARTAALFKRPTRDFEQIVNDGRTTMVGLSAIVGFTPLQGGVPLIIDGQVVGAIGVSGAASAQQDDEIAQAAGDRFGTRGAGVAVLHVPRREVTRAFQQGAPLQETAGYKVHASRRDRAGEAEVHLRDSDVFYVLDGSASLVTGGTLVNARETAEDEIRGTHIDGGAERRIGRGDVVVVPQGVPHWFKAVSAPVTYLVVKSSL